MIADGMNGIAAPDASMAEIFARHCFSGFLCFILLCRLRARFVSIILNVLFRAVFLIF